jgi:hypothetical protein
MVADGGWWSTLGPPLVVLFKTFGVMRLTIRIHIFNCGTQGFAALEQVVYEATLSN